MEQTGEKMIEKEELGKKLDDAQRRFFKTQSECFSLRCKYRNAMHLPADDPAFVTMRAEYDRKMEENIAIGKEVDGLWKKYHQLP